MVPPLGYSATMTNRRPRGDGGISFDHPGPCRDNVRHRHCPGQWRGEVTLGFTPEGKRSRRRVKGRTKAEVQEKLKALNADLEMGIIPKAGYSTYTVRQASEDWLKQGLDGRAPKTIKKNENVLGPILTTVGGKKLRELTAADVQQALTRMATRYSSAAVAMGHNALTQAIRHAEAHDLVARNVATLVDTPKGRAGRPSKSLAPEQAIALFRVSAEDHPALDLHAGLKDHRRPPSLMHAYIVLSLTTGLRTEEIRALRWDHVDLKGDPGTDPPTPPHVYVWRSVRGHGDTKTLRHTFVSFMSQQGMATEEIARLVGHSSSRTTEVVYRHELRPVIRSGAEIMNKIFKG
jgi:integrase